MDNQRLFTWGIFGLLVWFTYQTWLQDYSPKPVVTQTTQSEVANGPQVNESLPALDDSLDNNVDAPQLEAVTPTKPSAPATQAPIVRIKTDVLDLDINTLGGTIQRATLLNYPVAKDQPDTLVSLLTLDENDYGVLQTGLRVVGAAEEPTHEALFYSARQSFDMGADDELVVPLTWQAVDGTTVEKRFTFTRGSYKVLIEQVVSNKGEGLWRGANYAQIQRASREPDRSMFDVDSYSFVGPIIYDGKKSEKLAHDDLVDDGAYSIKATNGWLGSIEHHFLSAIVPQRDTEQSYTISVNRGRATASMISSVEAVPPGATETFTTVAFVGPKMQSQLEEIDESLKLTVDYGWLTIISQPLFWLLSFVFGFVGNWGVAIIVVTFLIKLVFYKLTESSGRSMAKMRNLQPRMKALQDRYKDDKPALSQAMMDLYKREKVNPAAGCLPILIQMPFFLAFYWVLLESVEMRQAPFALWITDLSTKDPYFILPLIMGAAMFMQQKLNPAPADPVQAKVMQIMPIMFTAFFAFFPSGLVLYWVTNTLLSIAQQWKINRVVEMEAKQAKQR